MHKVSQFFHYWYMRFFRWFLSPEHRGHPVWEFKVHMLLVVLIITGILMWAYAFGSYSYVDHPSIKYMGFIYALIHLSALLVYKYTGSITAATYTMLVPGGIFQTHFALLTGGFFTTTIVWVGILPVIAGILTDKFHTIIWGCFAFAAIIMTFCLTMMGLTADHFINSGRIITQFQVTFGMITLNSTFTFFLLVLASKYEEIQKKRKIAFQNLLRIMVHDIANPLTVILNMARGLPYVKDDPTQEKYFQDQIISQSTKMSNIIESVRWMEGLESGKKIPQMQSFNLKTTIANAVLSLDEMAKNKMIVFEMECPDSIIIQGHPMVIENQVITNILSNCIKFSPANSVIKILMTGETKTHIEISIIDQGIGIPQQILENIFDPYYPTTRAGTNGEEGTGFGMPIAKKSMEFFKGDISILTKEKELYPTDHGTTFKISFKR